MEIKRLIIIILAGIFFVGCSTIPDYNPSPEQKIEDRKAYEQYERDRVQRDVLRELKELNRRK